MKKKSHTPFLLILFLIFSFSAFAQENESSKYRIGITNGAFTPEIRFASDFNPSIAEMFNGKYFCLIQFYAIPTDEQRKLWEGQGLYLTDYLPVNTYFAVVERGFPLASINHSVRAILPIDKRFKLETELFVAGIPNYALKGGQMAHMTLSYYRILQPNAVIADLQMRGIEVQQHRDYSWQLDVTFDPARLDEVTALPYIQFIGAQPGERQMEANNLSHRNTTDRSNYINTGFGGITYNGTGIVVDNGEGGTVENTLDFKGRFTELTSGGFSSHKEGCLENAGGAGNIDPQTRSHAWGATLLSTDNENYPNLITTQNARYFNHSYGYGVQGGYSSSARDHDLRVVAYPNHVVSYSSGNTGEDTGYAPYNGFGGWGNITGSVKHNKNHMVVANLAPDDEVLIWGCHGPASDGRILPHIIVEGSEGTSYASPKAVGLFAELEQAYKASHSGAESPGSLMRVIVYNTADDMYNPGPDFKSGYGRPNARRALNVILNNQFISGTISQGNTNTHTVVVPSGTKQIKAMLVWPDAAAAVNASPAIVNNLNLKAINPSSTAYNPWVLDPTPNIANLTAPATRQIDNLNTIEQITVDNPDAGTWTLQVNGFSVPSGPQNYFISYAFVGDELSMAYPLENEKFISGDNYYLRWDSYSGTGTFTIDYQIDGGSWTNLAYGISADTRTYLWTAPFTSGIHTIKFRVKRGSLTSESGTNYFGQVPANFRVSKVCSDTVTLSWSALGGATSYKVYRLGAKYMDEVTTNITYAGNSAVLTGQSTSGSEYYAISAVTGALEGQRTIAIEKAPGDFYCASTVWTGTTSTDWFTASNWATGLLPTCADNVVIPASAPFQPFIGANGAACGNMTIETGATLSMSGTTGYTLSVCGDWINNGTFVRGIDTVDFVGTNAIQEIKGSSTTAFYVLKVTKGDISRILEVSSMISLNAATNPLVLVSGTFELSSNATITPFTNATGANLSSSKGMWNNGGTINYGNISWFNNGGLLKVSAGTINSGTNSNNNIVYLNGGKFVVEGGALNVAGGIMPNSGTSSGSFTQYGGTVLVCKVGSTSTTRGAFEINSGVPFTWSGGDIIINRASSNTTADYINASSSNSILGGTLHIGSATTPTGQTIRINSSVPVSNLQINNTNSPTATLVTNGLTVKNNVTISGGTFNANNLNVTVGGDWSNSGTFSPGTATVTFSGALAQNILGSSVTAFNGLTLNNSSGLNLGNTVNTQVNGVLTLTSGVITTNSNVMVIGNSGTVARTSGHIFGHLQKNFSGSALSNTFEVGDAASANYTPLSLTFSAISGAGNIIASTQTGDHASIASSTLDGTKSVNRIWHLQNSGVVFTNYNAVCNFLSSDVDAGVNTANIEGAVYAGGSWSYPTAGTRTANSTQLLSAGTLGDIQLAMNCKDSVAKHTVSVCNSYTWPVNGNTFNTSGVYVQTNTSPKGCTITDSLFLTIKTPTTQSIFQSACVSYTLNGTTYTTSGTYTQTLTNLAGCDSTITLNLTIKNNSATTLTQTACGSYVFAGNTLTATGTYHDTLANSAGCDSVVTLHLTINTSCASTWTGAINSNWSNAGNWSPAGVPNNCATNVIIPSGTTNPVVLDMNPQVGDLTVANGVALDLATHNLSLCGNWMAGSGTNATVSGTGAVVLSGGTAHTISGNTTFDLLTLNDAAGAALASGAMVNINNRLSLQNGVLNSTSGTLRFLSTSASHCATIDHFSAGYTGTLVGPILTERYVPVSGSNQHYISSPVNNLQLNQWNASGSAGFVIPTANCDETALQSGSPYGTVFRFNEANGASCSLGGWEVVTAGTAENSRGYSVYRTGGTAYTLSGTANLNGSYTLSGNTNSSWTNTTLQGRTQNSGWTLAGNPFLANINAISLSTNNVAAGFDAQLQVWQSSGAYSGTYLPAGVIGAPVSVIAPHQAFMAHKTVAGGTANYTVDKNTLTLSSATFYKMPEMMLTMEVSGNGFKDITAINFNTAATTNFDVQYDANKLESALGQPTLASLQTSGSLLAVNALPSIQQQNTVPLFFKCGHNGNFTFSYDLSLLDPTVLVALEDKQLGGAWIDLRTTPTYSFTANTADHNNRFVLHFSPALEKQIKDAVCSTDGELQLKQDGFSNWNAEVKNSTNAVVWTGSVAAGNTVKISLPANIYQLSLNTSFGYVVNESFQINATTSAVTAAFHAVNNVTIHQPVAFTNQSTGNMLSYNWNFGDGNFSGLENPNHSYTAAGTYTVQLTVSNADGCESNYAQTITVAEPNGIIVNGTTKEIVATVKKGNTLQITFNGFSGGMATIQAYNLLGQEIVTAKHNTNATFTKSFDNVEATYIIVRVAVDGQITTKKVFVSNE